MERETKSYTEAHEYFDRIFREACDIVTATNDAVNEDVVEANAALPFDAVRVMGSGERQALMQELMEYTQAAWHIVIARIQNGDGTIDHNTVCQIILPQLFLAFMSGYRHAIEEVDIPLSMEGVLPDGPTI